MPQQHETAQKYLEAAFLSCPCVSQPNFLYGKICLFKTTQLSSAYAICVLSIRNESEPVDSFQIHASASQHPLIKRIKLFPIVAQKARTHPTVV